MDIVHGEANIDELTSLEIHSSYHTYELRSMMQQHIPPQLLLLQIGLLSLTVKVHDLDERAVLESLPGRWFRPASLNCRFRPFVCVIVVGTTIRAGGR